MEHKKSTSLVKKMITQLLLSVSIFSFAFSYYSLCSSSPLYSRKLHYFPANPFQFPTHAMNKNYIFLICNGLLVFLAKTSGLVRCSSGFDLNDMLQKKIDDGLLTYSFETKEPFLPKEEEKKVVGQEENEILNEEPKEVSIFIAESDEERGIACDLEGVLFDDTQEEGEEEVMYPSQEVEEEGGGEEEEEEDHAELLSTEELNQKFEEFIRRMKEEIMINEARQLVMVK